MTNNRWAAPVWILVALCGFSACDDRAVPTSMEEATPLEEFLPCDADDDCLVVQSSCNGCCQRTTVNRRSSVAYREHRRAVCAAYFGVVCACVVQPARAVCRAERCTLEATDGGWPRLP